MHRIVSLILVIILLLAGCSAGGIVPLEDQAALESAIGSGDDIPPGDEEETPELGTAVTFVDAKLEAVIREAINSTAETIYSSELAAITDIDARSGNITDLRGIEYCTNLGSLWLSGNTIADLSPLAELQGQKRENVPFTSLTIYLTGSGLTDISALAGLTGPDELILRLGRNSIVDVTPLSRLHNLIGLHLAYNQIVDVRPLAGLTGLTQLNLEYNQITDASPLSELKADIYLEGNPLNDA